MYKYSVHKVKELDYFRKPLYLGILFMSKGMVVARDQQTDKYGVRSNVVLEQIVVVKRHLSLKVKLDLIVSLCSNLHPMAMSPSY